MTDLLKLSLTDIFILNYLQRFPGKISRKSLLETLNAIVEDEETISSSTFYHRINHLHRMGLLILEEEGKKGYISLAPSAEEAIIKIDRITISSTIEFNETIQGYLPDFMEKTGLHPLVFENMLIINQEEGINTQVLDIIAQFAHNVFILSNDKAFRRYKDRIENFNFYQSKEFQGKIREPDGFFDAVVYVGYNCCKCINHGVDHENKHSLEESYRVLKNGGLLIINSLRRLPVVDHVVFKELRESIINSLFFKFSDPEQLKEELSDAHFKDVRLFDYHGILIALGTK